MHFVAMVTAERNAMTKVKPTNQYGHDGDQKWPKHDLLDQKNHMSIYPN